jgi:hypothetical protein
MESGKLLPLDDFSRIENAKEPLKRGTGGAWMTDKDFLGCFQYIQVFHNPKKFKHAESYLVNSNEETELTGYDDKEILIIEGTGLEEEKSNSTSPQKNLLYCNNNDNI